MRDPPSHFCFGVSAEVDHQAAQQDQNCLLLSVGDLSCHGRMDAFYRNVVLLPPRAQGSPRISCMKALFRCTSGSWALTMTMRSMFAFVENAKRIIPSGCTFHLWQWPTHYCKDYILLMDARFKRSEAF